MLVVLALVASTARADVGLVSISRVSGRPGTSVVARFGGYDREWPRMPLYLVASSKAPRGSPKVANAPKRWPYIVLGRVHFAPPFRGRLRFRVPRVRAGAYRFVLYCAPCYRGPGGSLISTVPTFRVLR